LSKTSKFLAQGHLTPWWLFIGFLAAYLPFLSQGYGKEFDAWSNALNARVISQTGIYEVSRLPGHPLYELLLSALYPLNHSYFFFNLLSALASATAIALLYKIAHHYRLKNALWLALCFGFTPVFFIAATFTIDYNFALCFVLASLLMGLQKKPLLAGLFIALATGFRISSFGFVLPYTLLLAPLFSRKDFVKFYALAALGSALAFLPPLLTYGLSFLDFHKPPFPSLANILYKLSFGIWGVPLLLGLLIFVLLALKRLVFGSPPDVDAAKPPRLFWWALLALVAMQLAVFLRLPFKSEFFIPALPFILLAVFIGLKPKEGKWLAYSSLFSLLFFGFDYHQSPRSGQASATAFTFNAGGKTIFLDPLQGPLLLDQSKRKQKAATVQKAIDTLKAQPRKVWLVAGWYWPHLSFKYPNSIHHFEHYGSQAEVDSALSQGYRIFYLPEMQAQNEIMEGFYLADSIAEPLLVP
jgi:hypothetical protein